MKGALGSNWLHDSLARAGIRTEHEDDLLLAEALLALDRITAPLRAGMESLTEETPIQLQSAVEQGLGISDNDLHG